MLVLGCQFGGESTAGSYEVSIPIALPRLVGAFFCLRALGQGCNESALDAAQHQELEQCFLCMQTVARFLPDYGTRIVE